MDRRVILLDFLSPDNRRAYGTFSNLSIARHERLLAEALNVAIFLCGEYCLIPPAFIADDYLVRRVLRQKAGYLEEGLIRFPMRESTLEEFFEKKTREYDPVKDEYGGFFSRGGRIFVTKYAELILPRSSHVGEKISRKWEQGPDIDAVWKPILAVSSAREVEALCMVPMRLKERDVAITWAAIKATLQLPLSASDFLVQQALQHAYGLVYLAEYNAMIVTNVPPKTSDFELGSGDLSYDYCVLRDALAPISLWKLFLALSAESLIAIRRTIGYLEFMNYFQRTVSRLSPSRARILYCFAAQAKRARQLLRNEDWISSRLAQRHAGEMFLTRDEVELFSDRLLVMCMERGCYYYLDRMGDESVKADILIVIALKEEFRHFESVFGQGQAIGDYPSYYKYSLALGSERRAVVALLVGEKGHLPTAAGTVMAMERVQPELVVMLGIAAGIHKDLHVGDVVVATSVDAYIESAKASPHGEQDYVLKPAGEVYRGVDDDTLTKIRNLEFRHREAFGEWQTECSLDLHSSVPAPTTTELLRKELLHEPVILDDGHCASGPFVAASTAFLEWIRRRDRDYKILDMESGGVEVAAYKSADAKRTLVVRGISDFGDERKGMLEAVQSSGLRGYAMRNASRLLMLLIREGVIP
jgi:nucleoside phosphorylase